MTCVFMKVEVKKIILQEWLQLQMKLSGVITWKLLFDGEGITLLIGKYVSLLRRIFLVGEMSKFSGFLLRFRGRWQSTPGGGNKATSKEGVLLVGRGIQGCKSGGLPCWTHLFCSWMGETVPLLNLCHSFPTIIYILLPKYDVWTCDTPLEFCWC